MMVLYQMFVYERRKRERESEREREREREGERESQRKPGIQPVSGGLIASSDMRRRFHVPCLVPPVSNRPSSLLVPRVYDGT